MHLQLSFSCKSFQLAKLSASITRLIKKRHTGAHRIGGVYIALLSHETFRVRLSEMVLAVHVLLLRNILLSNP